MKVRNFVLKENKKHVKIFSKKRRKQTNVGNTRHKGVSQTHLTMKDLTPSVKRETNVMVH